MLLSTTLKFIRRHWILALGAAAVSLSGCGGGGSSDSDVYGAEPSESRETPSSKALTLQYGAFLLSSGESLGAAQADSANEPHVLRVSIAEPILELTDPWGAPTWGWSPMASVLSQSRLHAVVPVLGANDAAEGALSIAPALANITDLPGAGPVPLVLSVAVARGSSGRSAPLKNVAGSSSGAVSQAGHLSRPSAGTVSLGGEMVGVIGATCEPLRLNRTPDEVSSFVATIQQEADRLHSQGVERIVMLCSDPLESTVGDVLSTLQRVDVVVSQASSSTLVPAMAHVPPNGDDASRWIRDLGEPMLWLTVKPGVSAEQRVRLAFDSEGRLMVRSVEAASPESKKRPAVTAADLSAAGAVGRTEHSPFVGERQPVKTASDRRIPVGQAYALSAGDALIAANASGGPTEGQRNWTLMILEDYWRSVAGKKAWVSLAELQAAIRPGTAFSRAVGAGRMPQVRAVVAYWAPRWAGLAGADGRLSLSEILDERIRLTGPGHHWELWALTQLKAHWGLLPGWQDGLNQIELQRAIAPRSAFEREVTPGRAARVRAVVGYLVRPEVWPVYTANTRKLTFSDVVIKMGRLDGVPVDLAVSGGYSIWYTLSDSEPLKVLPRAMRFPEGQRVRFVVRQDSGNRAHMLNSGFIRWAKDTRTLKHRVNGALRITQGGVVRYQAAPYDPRATFNAFAAKWLELEREVERSPFDSRDEMIGADDLHPWLVRLRPKLRESHALLQQIVRVGQDTMTLSTWMRREGLYGGLSTYERAYEAYQYYLLDVLAREDAATLENAAKLARFATASVDVLNNFNRFRTAGTAADVKREAILSADNAAMLVESLTSDSAGKFGFDFWQMVELTEKLSDLGVDERSLNFVVAPAVDVKGRVWGRPSMDIIADQYARTISKVLDNSTSGLDAVRTIVIDRNRSEQRESQLMMIFAITDMVGAVAGFGAGMGKAVMGFQGVRKSLDADDLDLDNLKKSIYDVVDFVPDVAGTGRSGYNSYRNLDAQGSTLTSDSLFDVTIDGAIVPQRPAFREMAQKLKAFYVTFHDFFADTQNIGSNGRLVSAWEVESSDGIGRCLDGDNGRWPWGTRIDRGTLCAYFHNRSGVRQIFDKEGRLGNWTPTHGRWTLQGYLDDALAFPITYGQVPPADYGPLFWYSYSTKRKCDSENITCSTVLRVEVRKP